MKKITFIVALLSFYTLSSMQGLGNPCGGNGDDQEERRVNLYTDPTDSLPENENRSQANRHLLYKIGGVAVYCRNNSSPLLKDECQEAPKKRSYSQIQPPNIRQEREQAIKRLKRQERVQAAIERSEEQGLVPLALLNELNAIESLQMKYNEFFYQMDDDDSDASASDDDYYQGEIDYTGFSSEDEYI